MRGDRDELVGVEGDAEHGRRGQRVDLGADSAAGSSASTAVGWPSTLVRANSTTANGSPSEAAQTASISSAGASGACRRTSAATSS